MPPLRPTAPTVACAALFLLAGCVSKQSEMGVRNLWRDPSLRPFEKGRSTLPDVLLSSLSVMLNSAQSLRCGKYGLQLRIAPLRGGQHALEMGEPATEQMKKRIKRDYEGQSKAPF